MKERFTFEREMSDLGVKGQPLPNSFYIHSEADLLTELPPLRGWSDLNQAEKFACILPFRRIHERMTRDALKALSFSPKAIKEIIDANTDTDWNITDPLMRKYKPEYHFDRTPGVTNEQAFREGTKYVYSRKERSLSLLKQGKLRFALRALGKALHPLQDFFSHSNYVDLPPEAQQIAWEALLDPAKDPPAGIKLTGYDPNAKEPGKPPSDTYPHDKYNLDRSGSLYGKTKLNKNESRYQRAAKEATRTTKEFVSRLCHDLKKDIGDEMGQKLWNKFLS